MSINIVDKHDEKSETKSNISISSSSEDFEDIKNGFLDSENIKDSYSKNKKQINELYNPYLGLNGTLDNKKNPFIVESNK